MEYYYGDQCDAAMFLPIRSSAYIGSFVGLEFHLKSYNFVNVYKISCHKTWVVVFMLSLSCQNLLSMPY